MRIDKQELRNIAQSVASDEWMVIDDGNDEYQVIVSGSLEDGGIYRSYQSVANGVANRKTADFIAAFNPATVLALLDELEAQKLTAAATDVLAERQRQQSVEGWTPEHDDIHAGGQLADAAASYALYAHINAADFDIPDVWPWDMQWWKPGSPRRNLVKSGALILAEIERIDRKESAK